MPTKEDYPAILLIFLCFLLWTIILEVPYVPAIVGHYKQVLDLRQHLGLEFSVTFLDPPF